MPEGRTYSLDDQIAFAELSGDYNPIHLDPLAARRTMYGSPVVHGINLLLYGLDVALRDVPGILEIVRLDALFKQPITIGHGISAIIRSASADGADIDICTGERVAATFSIAWTTTRDAMERECRAGVPAREEPVTLSISDAPGIGGTLELILNPEAVERYYPAVAKRLAPRHVALLLATTRLVGMKCPGLHSLYSELHLHAAPPNTAVLQYQVGACDRRFSAVEIEISGAGLAGTVRGFFRPPPQLQLSCKDAMAIVSGDEFADQRAFVVGGSRGLGEVAAKLLAAGGAQVEITFNRGRADAEAVVDDIRREGRKASLRQLNVLDGFGSAVPGDVTHLYYYATPSIHTGSVPGTFDAKAFDDFCACYVAGFVEIHDRLLAAGTRYFYYPSSIAVTELPGNMAEYAAAKQAGETMVRHLRKQYPDGIYYAPRLPRLATDQTASLIQGGQEDSGEIILKTLRCFRDRIVA